MTNGAENRRPEALDRRVASQMSNQRTTRTKPESELRSELHRRGLRFRVNLRGMAGRPDIVLTRARIAIFVDGCFWHACTEHGTLPKNNREWWTAKFEAKRERDKRKDAQLRAEEFDVIHVWEHENVQEASDRIEQLWRTKTARGIAIREEDAPVCDPGGPEISMSETE